jgi:diguanylate cyclase (GGDEF)-like protein
MADAPAPGYSAWITLKINLHGGAAEEEAMRRVIARWWLVGAVLLTGVLVLAHSFYANEVNRHAQQQRATQRQAVNAVRDDVDDVLVRERSLAGVIQAVGRPTPGQWPALANIVTSEPAATGAGFIVPVSEHDRRAFERATGLRLLESPRPGVVRTAAPRRLHLVAVDSWSKTNRRPTLGIDLADNALRRDLMLEAARTHRQLATPPVQFLGRSSGRHGVIVYVPAFGRAGRLIGWVTVTYQDAQLTATVESQVPGARVTIRDGATSVVGSAKRLTGQPGTVLVAGRRWHVYAAVPGSGIGATPWLVLGFGLALTIAVSLILRQAGTRERYAARVVAQRDAEDAALSRIATLVAQSAAPDAVFASVAEEVGSLLRPRTAAVSRFDRDDLQGTVVGGWTPEGENLAGALFALDGMTASAEVFRTGQAARTGQPYRGDADPIVPVISRFGGEGGVAAPIVVAGELWGALGSAFGPEGVPAGAEERLERFGRLVGLAISNAAAWERLDRQASTDALTGIANRRVFDERLTAEVARAERHDRQVSLALFDLDHFKRINDAYGHQTGDRALAQFARILTEHARRDDVVARVGGEEFAWLMPETDQDGAFAAAERVRAALELERDDEFGAITVSAGVVIADHGSTAQSLFHAADRALYEAKESGRNTTVVRVATVT